LSAFQFELASYSDEPRLRQLMRTVITPGNTELVFPREPDFFSSLATEGDNHQVMVVRKKSNSEIVGFGVRSIQHRYVNGVVTPVGYLSALRLTSQYRGRGLVLRGYRFLRELHQNNPVPFYLTTIAHGNKAAERMLTAGTKGMPHYHPFGSFDTLVIPVRRYPNKRRREDLHLRSAKKSDESDISLFLTEEGSSRNLAHHYAQGNVIGSSHLQGLDHKDLLLAYSNGVLVGILGGWDQYAFRQAVVHKYNGYLRYMRRIYNIMQQLRGASGLPDPGQPLRYRLGALCIIKDWDASIFAALLERQLTLSREGPYHYFLIGLHDTDPLLSAARKYALATYRTGIYAVDWGDGEYPSLTNDFPFHVELGCL